jgi:hypothetical protein
MPINYNRKKIICPPSYNNFMGTLFDLFILFYSFFVIFINNEIQKLPYIGTLIILISIYLLFKFRHNHKLLFLFGVIGFMNISLGVSDLINKGLYVADWQLAFRATIYNIYFAESILLFLSIVNVVLSHSWAKHQATTIEFIEIKRKNNPIIAYLGIIALFYIIFKGYGDDLINSNGYVSNNNPIYEYAVVIFIMVWLYSGKNFLVNKILIVYALLYTLQSFFFGDRSAAFLMVFLFFLLYYKKKVSFIKIIFFAIFAILLSNFIGEFRTGGTLSIETVMNNVQNRGLYIDTVSYSYYTGITITSLQHYNSETTILFIEFLKSIIMGSGFSENANLANYARHNYKDLFNRGGGMYISHFYAWFGFGGVILGSAIFSFIIRKVFSSSHNISQIYQILILVFSLRWYLYSPIVLFRSVFIISTILILACIVFNKISPRGLNKKIKVEGIIKTS